MLYKYEHFLFNHKLDLPLSPTNILCLKYYPHNLKKYEIKGASKSPISQIFSELVKIWKYNLTLYSKKPNFQFFS